MREDVIYVRLLSWAEAVSTWTEPPGASFTNMGKIQSSMDDYAQ